MRVIQYTATQSTQTNTSMAARGQKCTGGPKIWAINIVRANLSLTDSVRLRLLLLFPPPHFLGQEIFSSAYTHTHAEGMYEKAVTWEGGPD